MGICLFKNKFKQASVTKKWHLVWFLVTYLVVLALTPKFAFAQTDRADLGRFHDLTIILPPQGFKSQMTMQDVKDVIPTDMIPTGDQSYVAKKIADRTIQNIMKSPEMKENPFVRSADDLQKKMNYKVEIGGETEESVKHKFDFQFLAFQNIAKIKYNGWWDCNFLYEAPASRSEFELVEKLKSGKDLVLSQINNPYESYQQISLRFPWP